MSPKRIPWLVLGVCCLLSLTTLSSSPARAASGGDSGQIDVNFFYDTLKDDGSWFNTTEYGDVWQPYIAYKSDSWRPYTDGYWSYTDGGWMFVSNENFGWAVYHYGRWTKLQDIGWAWVPGTEWAPAWVTWRESKPDAAGGTPAADAPVSATTTDAPPSQPPPPPADDRPRASGAAAAPSENYIGWAPLPPEPIAYNTDYSYGPTVDVDFGIDPYAYVFTDYRSFGSPWIAGVIFDSDRGYYCCDHSVNITNIYYNGRGGGRGYRGFYNGGPDYNRFRGVTERPIPQLALNRTTSSSLVRQQIRNGQFNRVNGNQLNVAAPRFSQANVRNGRVNFTRRGTLPVTPVSKQIAPASAANNEKYQRARESFAKQGETYRAQNPNAPAARRNAPNAVPEARGNNGPAGGIATTPRAQQEERQARQAAERQGNPGGNNNAAAPGAPNAQPQTRAERRTASREAQRQAHAQNVAAPNGGERVAAERRQTARQGRGGESRRAGGGGGERAVRQQRAPAAPRMVERQAPRIERGGGGGAPRGGGGGGGGEHARGGGGNGGGGEKKKK